MQIGQLHMWNVEDVWIAKNSSGSEGVWGGEDASMEERADFGPFLKSFLDPLLHSLLDPSLHSYLHSLLDPSLHSLLDPSLDPLIDPSLDPLLYS